MTREEIEKLDDTEPYSFETDREEWWYKIGLKEGLETADKYPREGLVDIEKACTYLEFVFKQLAGYYSGTEYTDAFRKAMLKED